jgi:creatinine amidohydrolase
MLTSATAKDERDRDAEVALLPIGSFEQHGDYLPLTTDTLVACAIANEIARSRPAFVLAPVAISCSHEHAAWRGTVSISARTLHQVVTEIADSVRASGVAHVTLISGHGGNYVLSNVVQEYTATHGPVMSLFPRSSDWTEARHAAEMETDQRTDMHAGELEVSVLLATTPEVVRDGYETADWTADERPDLLTLGMSAYTKSGVIGRPSLGTAAKGQRLLAALASRFTVPSNHP